MFRSLNASHCTSRPLWLCIGIFFLVLAALAGLVVYFVFGSATDHSIITANVSENTTVLQTKDSTHSLIARVNASVQTDLTFTKMPGYDDQAFQIDFYGLPCHSVEERRRDKKFQPKAANRIDDRYTLRSGFVSTLYFTFYINWKNVSLNNTEYVAALVTFDNRPNYEQFLANKTWSNSYAEHYTYMHEMAIRLKLV